MSLNDRQSEFKRYLKDQLFNSIRPLMFDELETTASGFADLLYKDLTPYEVNEVLKQLTQENTVKMALGDSIVDKDTFEPWIERRRKETETPRWDAYKKLLIRRDWEENVIRTLDVQTDEVVELLGDPLSSNGEWPRRGLLMGEVQSGKTATYLGILNKALDYGYGLIVVIGGHTEDLRQQTQMRFDTDLLGVDSETWDDGINNSARRYVGVGENSNLRAHLMTTVRHDFSKSKRGSSITWVDGGLPTVFITKKTPSLINNIRTYIKDQAPGGRLDIPLIVVDDESDWGTPNTRDKVDPTSVNLAIRALLDVSTRSSYLAITATPFANIFMDDQAAFEFHEKPKKGDSEEKGSGAILSDLFPSDYIRVTFPPNNYSGIGTYFGEGGHSAISVAVEDCVALIPIKHKNHHPVAQLPQSMEAAVMQFMLGTAVRRLRDNRVRPASMLINVSRFKSVMHSVASLVDAFRGQVVDVILAEFARNAPEKSLAATRLREVWDESFAEQSDVSWEQVSKKLLEIAGEFRTELINGDTAKDRAKRRKLMTVTEREADDLIPRVVVGGDILSRGLTLEGLQVSYFVREPRTMDTLMQMGRWFGYRPAFGDLVRIWMPETTQLSFSRSAEVTEELRETLLEMKARELTPKDFGLRVRVHPDSVDIVAANKGRNAETVSVGPTVWENRLLECVDLPGDDESDRANQEAVESLIARLGSTGSVKTFGGYDAWVGVSVEAIQDFFRQYQGAPGNLSFGRAGGSTLPVADAIRVAPGPDRWQVVLVTTTREGEDHHFGPSHSVKMSVRNRMKRHRVSRGITLSNRRLATASDVVNSLVASERERIVANPALRTDGSPMSSQALTLARIDHPILLVYVVTAPKPTGPEGENDFEAVDPGTTRVAVAIAFPKMTQEQIADAAREARTYKVNQVFWRAYNGFVDDLGDDEIDGDGDDL
jgi:hypothetical protein